MSPDQPVSYVSLLTDIRLRIRYAQIRAVLAVNAELTRLYWEVGAMIDLRQRQEGWGTGVIPRLARDLRNELPEVKGFSDRNIKLMVQFFRVYPDLFELSSIGQPVVAQLEDASCTGLASIGQPVVAQLEDASCTGLAPIGQPVVAQLGKVQSPVAQIPWAHNVVLMQKVKDPAQRQWYAWATLQNGWSRSVLVMHQH
ncbi:MAG: hypothetical protein HQL91_01745 [Magnetococcales bacterium]|nr:hypothetical protein [Magnetococcales bacterium]